MARVQYCMHVLIFESGAADGEAGERTSVPSLMKRNHKEKKTTSDERKTTTRRSIIVGTPSVEIELARHVRGFLVL